MDYFSDRLPEPGRRALNACSMLSLAVIKGEAIWWSFWRADQSERERKLLQPVSIESEQQSGRLTDVCLMKSRPEGG